MAQRIDIAPQKSTSRKENRVVVRVARRFKTRNELRERRDKRFAEFAVATVASTQRSNANDEHLRP
jgi:hypothetical protein